jgi:hypothetical protein
MQPDKRIIIFPGEHCPMCGGQVLVDGIVYVRTPLGADGWSAFDGKIVETAEERVYCEDCNEEFDVDWEGE